MASKELQVLFLLLWLWFLGQRIEVWAQVMETGGKTLPDSETYGIWNATDRVPTQQILMSPDGNFSFNLLFTHHSRSSCAAVVIRNTWNVTTWVGNFYTTVVDSNTNTNCTLNFSASAGLVLSNGSNETIWSTEQESYLARLYLNNEGCLYITNSTKNWLWGSCDYPSDTLVTQQANTANLAGAAALSNYEYSRGNDFIMETNSSKYLILSQNISYNGSSFPWPYKKIRDWSANLTNSIDNGAWDYVRLQPNGSLVFKKASSSVIHPFFNDNCDIPGACGAFGICWLGVCSCLPGFRTSNLSTAFACEGPHASSSSICLEDQFVNVTGRTFLDASRFNVTEDIDAQSCLSRCRDNCTCTNALHLRRNASSSTGPCLLNLTSVLTIKNVTDLQTLFLRVPSVPVPAPAPTPSTNSSRRKTAALGFAGGAAAFLFLLLAGSSWWLFYKRRKLYENVDDTGKPDPPYEPAKLPPQYSYKELEESTGNFHRRLGYGWSSVFAGQNRTAIKVLDEEIEEKVFLGAVATMASLSHPNLVPLLGFCCEGRHKMLVYELVDEGQSLNSYLFRKDSSLLMNVQHRRMIALETARGLAYLHESQIIHGGVKPENIMIDSEMNIRLVDYGLVSLTFPFQKLITATDRGSRAYMAPEWSKSVPVTPKVDVYSFGVVLLELVSGRSCWAQSGVSEEKRFLPTWGFAVLGKGLDHLLEISDPRLDAQSLSEDDKQVLRGMIFVALWCVQEDPFNRYPMSAVVDMLNGDVAVDPPPPSPGLDGLASELYAIHGNNEPRTHSNR